MIKEVIVKCCFFIFLSFFSFNVEAQVNIDSLKNELKTLTEDTLKANTLEAIATAYLSKGKNDSVLFYSHLAESVSQKVKFNSGIAKSKFTAANALWNMADYAHAFILATEAKGIFQELNRNRDRIKCLWFIGEIYNKENNNTASLESFFESLSVAEKTNDTLSISRTFIRISDLYFNIDNYEKALEYALRAKPIIYRLDILHLKGVITERLGYIYEKLGNYDKALENQIEGFGYSVQEKDFKGVADGYYDLGHLYAAYNKFDKADENLRKGREAFDSLGLKKLAAICVLHLGMNYLKQSKKDSAVKYYFEFLKLSILDKDSEDIADAYLNIGLGYMALNKFDQAIRNLILQIEISKNLKSLIKMSEGYKNLSTCYEKLNNPSEAFRYYKLLVQLNDSIAKKDEPNKMNKLESERIFNKVILDNKLEQAKQQLLSAAEVNKRTMQRNLMVGGFVFMLIIAGISYRSMVVKKRDNKIILKEKARSDELLLNILPEDVAEELKRTGSSEAKQFDEVTVMFTDFKDFTKISERLSPSELVEEIHICFKAFDAIITKYNIEKIKTIGDSYMCAGGIPVSNTSNAVDVVNAALEMKKFMEDHLEQRMNTDKARFEIRIGIHIGPVVAGIVGVKKFAYDIWGDTVNTASRMESSGEAGKINISGATYLKVREKFNCVHRGKIPAKNKVDFDMYFVEGEKI